MSSEHVSASTRIGATPQAVFAMLTLGGRPEVREYLTFPPFPLEHLDRSLRHSADLVRAGA